MRSLRILLKKDSETFVKFDEPLVIDDNTMTVKSASVFWDYDNITRTTFVSYGRKKITFDVGYWTANMIIEKLKEANATAELIHHSRKIKITAGEDLTLLRLAPLLGFSNNFQRITKGNSATSEGVVNVNLGLKQLDVKCNAVDTSKTTKQGRRDNTIAVLPITTTQTLKGSVTHYDNINSKVKLNNGIYSELKFTTSHLVGEILLEITVK